MRGRPPGSPKVLYRGKMVRRMQWFRDKATIKGHSMHHLLKTIKKQHLNRPEMSALAFKVMVNAIIKGWK